MTTRYSDKPSEVEGFPQREWSIEVYLVNDKGEQVPATLFDKVTYHLHPSFGDRAVQCKSRIANGPALAVVPECARERWG